MTIALATHSLLVRAVDPATFCGTARWQPFIAEAAERFNLPMPWIDAVVRTESAGCAVTAGQPTTSNAGAMGLMQVMPETWAHFRDALHLGSTAHDPHDNILAGTAYLRELFDHYGPPGCFAAYHAGPARFEAYLSEARPLPRATLDYLSRTLSAAGPPAAAELSEGSRLLSAQIRVTTAEAVTGHANGALGLTHQDGELKAHRSADRTPQDPLFVILKYPIERTDASTPRSSDAPP